MDVFFYGLFMDIHILSQQGVKASHPRKAYLDNYSLKIGNRASLIPSKGEKAYGIVMSLEKPAVLKLYAEASVADYLPEEVSITLETKESIPAICYNLPPESMRGTNEPYARSLYALAQKLGLPQDYLKKIEKMTNREA